MNRETKAICFSILGALATAFVGFMSVNLFFASCGGSNNGRGECSKPEDCPAAAACMLAVCREGVCAVEHAQDGGACSQGGDAGLCLDGICRDDICFIDGSLYSRFQGVNPSNPCEVCDPARSTSAWSPVVCPAGTSSPCLDDAACDPAGGNCLGVECCVQAPAWDGTGNPLDCSLPSGAGGVCNDQGDCAGCQSNADCQGGAECQVAICGQDEICHMTDADDYTACTVDAASGKCLSGDCYPACINTAECDADEFCYDAAVCLKKRSNGQPCSQAEQCSDGFCSASFDADQADARCTAAECSVCERASNLGTCDPLPDGATEGCDGDCGGGAYDDEGGWTCCAGSCACIPTGQTCP